MSLDSSSLTPTRALHHLEQRRHFLQRLIAAARSIETLKHSMEQMLDQAPTEAGMAPRTAEFVEGLGRKVRNLSDAEVSLRLLKLDQRLRSLFEKLVPLIDQIVVPDVQIETLPLGPAEEDINALRRLAQTALALRALLARRGLKVPELHLSLDRYRLQQQLESVRGQEQTARRSVIQQVRELGKDIRELLGRPDLPAGTRSILDRMLAGLRDNLDHLKRGKSVSDLPMEIEATAFDSPLPQPLSAAPPQAEQVIPGDGEHPLETPPISGQEAGLANRSDSGGKLLRPGLARALRIWISSPWNVTWRDVREGRYRG